jgi:hypothetical protein
MWIEEDGDYWLFYMDLDHWDYIELVQVEMESVASEIPVNMRFVWKNGDG